MISNLLTDTVVSEQRITKLWKQLNATISLQQTNSVIWQIAIVKKEKEGEESGNLSINDKWINELSMSSCRYKKEERSNLRIRRKALESCDWMNLPPRNPFLSHIWWWWCDDVMMVMIMWWCDDGDDNVMMVIRMMRMKKLMAQGIFSLVRMWESSIPGTARPPALCVW